MSERAVQPAMATGDQPETSLRPQVLSEFIGQAQACSNLKVFIDAARARFTTTLLVDCIRGVDLEPGDAVRAVAAERPSSPQAAASPMAGVPIQAAPVRHQG